MIVGLAIVGDVANTTFPPDPVVPNRSAAVTSPVAVNAPVIVGDAIEGDVARAKFPVPVSAVQAITVVALFSITHGAVAPTTVVVPGVIVVAAPPTALITPPLAVMVTLSTLTSPNAEDDPRT